MKKFAKTTEINRRIKEVRERSGLTQKEFSGRIGISRSYLSEIEAGKVKPSMEALTGIVLRFEVDGRWLLMGEPAGAGGRAAEAPAPYGAPSRTASFPLLPLLDGRTAAGPPRPISSKEIAGSVPVWDAFPPKEGFCFYARDDGMAPLLRRGALVGVSPLSGSLKAEEGKIIAAWLPKGGLTLRRLRFDQKYMILEPEDKSHATLYVERSDRVALFRVDWWRLRQEETGRTGR